MSVNAELICDVDVANLPRNMMVSIVDNLLIVKGQACDDVNDGRRLRHHQDNVFDDPIS